MQKKPGSGSRPQRPGKPSVSRRTEGRGPDKKQNGPVKASGNRSRATDRPASTGKPRATGNQRPTADNSGKPGLRSGSAGRPAASRPYARRTDDSRPAASRPYARRTDDSRPAASRPGTRRTDDSRPAASRPGTRRTDDSRPAASRPGTRRTGDDRPAASRPYARRTGDDRPAASRPGTRRTGDDRPAASRPYTRRSGDDRQRATGNRGKIHADGSIRLNRYIANAGVCSRREADVLITSGAITINGNFVTELGTKVMPGDIVAYGGQRLHNERKVYLLLNKPKDFITTTEDPQERKTVFDLIKNACIERIYPVGRLDRNTTGLLLFTNDGDLTKKLTHPKHGVQKLYHVELDKPLTKADMAEIAMGVKIDDILVVPDSIAYDSAKENKKEVGIEIHSGQNRVVRRMFEQFGYKVMKLDRVVFAGLTKKDLPRGKWRFLTEKEVSFLKMLG